MKKIIGSIAQAIKPFFRSKFTSIKIKAYIRESYFVIGPSHFLYPKQDLLDHFSIVLYDKVLQTVKSKRIEEKNIRPWLYIKYTPPVRS